MKITTPTLWIKHSKRDVAFRYARSLPRGDGWTSLGPPPEGLSAEEHLARAIEAVPHWVARAAAGHLEVFDSSMPARLVPLVDEAAQQMAEKSAERARARHVWLPFGSWHTRTWRGLTFRVRRVRQGTSWVVKYYGPEGTNIVAPAKDVYRCLVKEAASRRIRLVADLGDGYHLLRRGPAGGRYWYVQDTMFDLRLATFFLRPTRAEVEGALQGLRALRAAHQAWQEAATPDPSAPDHLGWRAWMVDDEGFLVSPIMKVAWEDPELRATGWSDSSALRGEAGIHALRLPKDWRRAHWAYAIEGGDIEGIEAHGLVERFGRYVLGATGWRAEWVVVRGLVAYTADVAERLRRRYPEVPVHLLPTP